MMFEGEAVERGAALLDQKVPGWENKIQKAIFNGTFDITNWDHCVVGTLELVSRESGNRNGTLGFGIALNGTVIVDYSEAEEYGFTLRDDISESGEAWDLLASLWEDQVVRRVRATTIKENEDDASHGH